MEEELHCPLCKQLYNNPVLLPCYHALCLSCAVHLQQSTMPHHSITSTCDNAESVTSGSSGDAQESDKLSVFSETDSGVICSSTPYSYVGTPIGQSFSRHVLSLACPVCHKLVYFDENGAHNLPKYRVMKTIVERYGEMRNLPLKCQMCEKGPIKDATIMCEQCDVMYCDECKESCHPSRGPLAKHNLTVPGRDGPSLLMTNEGKCVHHDDETLSMFCLMCKIPVCPMCLMDPRHNCHDVQAATAICKTQKTELSHNLQQLSERAKSTTAFIQRLKRMAEKVNENCSEFEDLVSIQCEALVEAIYRRRNQLLECVRQDKELRVRVLKDQAASCTTQLQHTTSLLQFCIEALKEPDSISFLQVGTMLNSRVTNCDIALNKEWFSPRTSPNFELTLDDKSVLKAIEQLNFIQMKPPSPPTIIPEECSAENNSVTVAWQPPLCSHIEGYILELDDGRGGEFREVYCGTESMCTVDGLHFHSLYNARVKAFNSSGEGKYSDVIGLQTADVAWFTFDPMLSGPGLHYANDNTKVMGEGWGYEVALGGIGFSRGIHYWEFTIDKFDADTDPAFGIARINVSRDKMLGKDVNGWAMYIDHQRSWFQHDGTHNQRIEGGVITGSTVGVLLDLEKHSLFFYVNEEPQGGAAFNDLYGVFYPAVSVNRGVSVTIHTALDPPPDHDET